MFACYKYPNDLTYFRLKNHFQPDIWKNKTKYFMRSNEEVESYSNPFEDNVTSLELHNVELIQVQV